jgi:calpain-15
VRVKLFEDGVKPGDVAQGNVGNCWLIAALACVSEHPAIIRKIFLTKRASVRGKYKVQLFDARHRKWVVVTVDEHIPIVKKGQTHLFANPSGRELWVILLEKAFAKLCGSYRALALGHPVWAFNAITGDPVYHLSRQADGSWRRKDVTFDAEDLRKLSWRWSDARFDSTDTFFLLRTLSRASSLLGASSSNEGEAVQSNGLVKGHAYSILGARSFQDATRASLRINLVQLRNPWGKHEWNSAWGDNSAEWSTYPHIKRILKPVDANDGSFWMRWEDFALSFDSIDVCQRSTGLRDLNIDLHEADGCLRNCAGSCLGCCQGCGLCWYGRVPPFSVQLRSRARSRLAPWASTHSLPPPPTPPLWPLGPAVLARPGVHAATASSAHHRVRRCCCKGYKAIYRDYKASSTTMDVGKHGRDDDVLAVVTATVMTRSS